MNKAPKSVEELLQRVDGVIRVTEKFIEHPALVSTEEWAALTTELVGIMKAQQESIKLMLVIIRDDRSQKN